MSLSYIGNLIIRVCDVHRYQFNPDLYNPDVVINILIKALTSSPFPDFNLCISLLDERPANTNPDEPDPLPSLLPVITELHNLLQQCRFPAFWKLYNSERAESLRDNYTVECVGFEDAVRGVVVQTVKAAFRRIGSDRLSTYLHLTGNVCFFECLKGSFIDWYVQATSSLHMLQNSAGLWKLHPGSSPSLQTLTTRLSPLWYRKTSNCLVCLSSCNFFCI